MLQLPPQHKADATSCSHSNAICHHSFKKRIELRTQEQPLVARHIGGTIRAWNDRSRNRRTDEVPFIAGCSHFTRKNTRFRAPASSPTQIDATSCSHSNAICHHSFKKRIELRTQTQPLVAKHIGGTIRAWNDRSRNRRTDEVPFIAGCSHLTRKNTRFRAPASSPTQIDATSCSHSNAICHHSFKKRIELRTQEQPLVAKHIGGTIRAWNDRSRNRRTDEVPFIAGCSHFTRKNTRFRAQASSPTQSRCNIMQPFTCDLPPQLQETHRTTHAGTSTCCKTHRRNQSRPERPQPQPSHTRGTFHRWLQPFYTEKHKVSCSAFLPNSPLPFLTTSHRPPLPIVTTSLRPLPFLTTSLPHHFPSSPPPFLTIPLHHHFPSSPLPFVTTSLRHHFPSSPLPFVTTSLRHHPVIVTTLHQGQFHRFLFLCYVLLCYALLCDLPPFIKVNSTASLSPPFIKVNSTASYSCVMYCYVMYCYVIYHPSSRSIPPLLILVLCIVMLCIVICIVMWSTTLHQGQFHRFLFLCYVLLCYVLLYVLLCDLPPFIKVNSTASYSFVVYCFAMYCYVIYHPSSRSIPPLLILLLCIVMLCIVISRTTLHHSQFHQVKVIRNSEVLLPNFLWLVIRIM